MNLREAKRLAEAAGGKSSIEHVHLAAGMAKDEMLRHAKGINFAKNADPDHPIHQEIKDSEDRVRQAKTMAADVFSQHVQSKQQQAKAEVDQATSANELQKVQTDVEQTKVAAANAVLPHAQKSPKVAVDVFKAIHAPEPAPEQAPGQQKKSGLAGAKATAKNISANSAK
jgi:hypothetical protein